MKKKIIIRLIKYKYAQCFAMLLLAIIQQKSAYCAQPSYYQLIIQENVKPSSPSSPQPVNNPQVTITMQEETDDVKNVANPNQVNPSAAKFVQESISVSNSPAKPLSQSNDNKANIVTPKAVLTPAQQQKQENDSQNAYMNYLLAQNQFSETALELCTQENGKPCQNIKTNNDTTPQLNTYYVTSAIADQQELKNPSTVVPYTVIKAVENVKPDIETSIATGTVSPLQQIGNPETNNGTSSGDEMPIPPKSSNISLARKTGFYKSVFAALEGGGFGTVTMNAQANQTPNGAVTNPSYSVWSAPVDYIPTIYTGLRFGMQYPALAQLSYPVGYRWEVELSYMRLQAITGTPTVSSGQVMNISIPDGFANGNLINIGANAYVDLLKIGPGYPFIGAGVGFGIEIFDAYMSPSFIVPTIQMMAGYDFDLSNGMMASIAFKCMALMSTSYYLNGVNGNNNPWPAYQISTGQSNYAQFGWQFVLMLEFDLLFF